MEATVIPVPLELLLLPLLYWRRHQTWLICAVVTLTCLAGAAFFYFVGAFLYQDYGGSLLNWLGGDETLDQSLRESMDRHGFWAVLAIAVLPLPFQIGVLAAGAAGYSFWMFLLASLLGRGVRYFGLGWLVRRHGQQATRLWRKHRIVFSLVAGTVVMLLWLASEEITKRWS